MEHKDLVRQEHWNITLGLFITKASEDLFVK